MDGMWTTAKRDANGEPLVIHLEDEGYTRYIHMDLQTEIKVKTICQMEVVDGRRIKAEHVRRMLQTIRGCMPNPAGYIHDNLIPGTFKQVRSNEQERGVFD